MESRANKPKKPWGHRENRHPALKDRPRGLEMRKALPKALMGNLIGAVWEMVKEGYKLRQKNLKLIEKWERKQREKKERKRKKEKKRKRRRYLKKIQRRRLDG